MHGVQHGSGQTSRLKVALRRKTGSRFPVFSHAVLPRFGMSVGNRLLLLLCFFSPKLQFSEGGFQTSGVPKSLAEKPQGLPFSNHRSA